MLLTRGERVLFAEGFASNFIASAFADAESLSASGRSRPRSSRTSD